MASTTTRNYTTPATTRLSWAPALGVGGAVIAAVGIWVLAVPVLGLHLMVRFGSSAPESVGVDLVVGATAVASLLGWGLLAMLERRTSRALAIWTVAAIAVLLVSKDTRHTFGTTEFELRDIVHRVGAKALEASLAQKKTATTDPA